MDGLICANVYVPLRKGPSHKSEQGSQILFGEKYAVTDRSANWLKIVDRFDGYEGWIDGDHHLYYETGDAGKSCILARSTVFNDARGNKIILEPGSEIYNFNKNENAFSINNHKYYGVDEVITGPVNETPGKIAMGFLNCPYLWGGRTRGGMDCSGLTQLVYKLQGRSLPRDSFRQAEVGNTVSFLEEAAEGDLLFFDNNRGDISHVGMLLEKGYIIHCSGKVRVDRIDHQGIYNEEMRRYTHRLRTIKRMVED